MRSGTSLLALTHGLSPSVARWLLLASTAVPLAHCTVPASKVIQMGHANSGISTHRKGRPLNKHGLCGSCNSLADSWLSGWQLVLLMVPRPLASHEFMVMVEAVRTEGW